ncbi:AraC family transcriptional regulator [Paenibacillus sp. MSJ-34]|uniref:AraC family transcriptional regulator n=1 Tax=Paenibacillus sp. MSJ-34 TaxID=2841529 RepID=UPI001C11CDE9|nr:AraC family transcriptional regulator [Paenibacillus sp. MSJ-34]MBU5443582.1 AraC family transcriptional regulator [Paenibacillus sp. MSJ-34]
MSYEVREIRYDPDIGIEAYRFQGIMQKFPNHFHDYYVLGFIEQGKRHLICNNESYVINSGDVVIFNPHDPHACEQIDGKTLDYRCLNVKPDVMRRYALEITGAEKLPRFAPTVLYQSELAGILRDLHRMIANEQPDFQKEELLLLLIEQLLVDYSDAEAFDSFREPRPEIRTVCDYLEAHYPENIKLDRLSELTGLSKYHLLRSFTRQTGISPYSYLSTIRINNAKKLLESGISPGEAAFRCGFSDQSHFTNFFKKLIGLTPKQYSRGFASGQEAGRLAHHDNR